MEASRIMSKARVGLILDQPFFGSILMKMILKEDPGCETMWTDSITIGYDPAFVESIPIDEVKGVLAHEVMHVVMEHHLRLGGRDHPTWNKSCDYPINYILEQSGFSLPKDGLHDAHFGLMSADEVYTRIYVEPPPPIGGGGGAGAGGGGGGGGAGGGQDPGKCGEIRQPPGINGGAATKSDLEKAKNDLKVDIAQAKQSAKVAGKMPGFLERIIDEFLDPKVSWKDELRDFVDISAKNNYSWNRPNPRYVALGFYLPSLKSNEVGEIFIIVDTSGSVSKKQLKQFGAEISSILEDHEYCTLHVVYCDSEVYPGATQTFTHQDTPITLNAKGGGGTAFTPAFEYIDEICESTPLCVIYLTDMCCSDIPPEPEYPTLWVKVGNRTNRQQPFGRMIEMDGV